MPHGRSVVVGGRTLTLTNLDKVLYPETGTTKGDVVAYYAAVAPWMLPHCKDRAVTRKRWANGVDGQVFFEKNLPSSAPDWVRHHTIEHTDHDNEYPIVDDLPTLTWMAQQAALELHVPQWRFGPRGGIQKPDRLVLDLDPGDGVGLPECVEVALAAREVLHGMGLDPYPVTSGSKGIHLYAALDGRTSTEQVSEVAHELAKALEQDMPDLVLSSMSRKAREGKVFVDWSQNNGNKTTIAPYSMRGRSTPTVAAPRSWDELAEKGLAQLTIDEVVDRVRTMGDLLHPVAAGSLAVGRADGGHWDSDRTEDANGHERASRSGDGDDERPGPTPPVPRRRASGGPAVPVGGGTGHDRLSAYRSKRDASRTPEPVPSDAPTVRTDGVPTFVIQEHHASALHWDFRLEHDGVLVSWALPKGEPDDPGHNHLAVMTEDHPLEYGGFEGTIPGDQYGGGTVTIWDSGTAEYEKWREGKEVIVTLHGFSRGDRRLALLHTKGRGGDEKSWLIHRTKEQPGQDAAGSSSSTAGTAGAHATGSGSGADGADLHRASRPSDAATSRGAPTSSTEPADHRPMLASPARIPGALTPDDWAFEMKWDGVRALAAVRDGSVTLTSRNGNDLTAQYPELAALAEQVGVDAVLDGEIVALDELGRPDFGLLQDRMGLVKPREIAAARKRTPVRILLFDVLAADGHDLTRVTYEHRREALLTVVEPGGAVDVPPAFDCTLDEAMGASRARGLEGVVAKRRNSRYAEGSRSEAWVKVKHHATQEVVVGGWRPGAGRRAGGIGSLLLGVPGDDGLDYVGRVGTGFRDRDLDEIGSVLAGLGSDESPFVDVPRPDARDATWVTPTLVAEVEFAEWTAGGRLRQPSWRGWRPDKHPAEVVREAGGDA